MDSEYSRRRIPRPPQKITTFTRLPPAPLARLPAHSGAHLAGPHPCATTCAVLEVIVEPGLVAEVTVLLRAEPVGDAALGQLDVSIGEHLGLGDVVLQLAALDQPFGQIAIRGHLLGIHRLAVGHVHAILIQDLARLEVALGHRAYLHNGPAKRRPQLVTEEDDARNREGRLEMDEGVWDPERVERPLAHLVSG